MFGEEMPFITFPLSFVLGLIFITLVRKLAVRKGMEAHPREDRWHKKATPILGGVAIFMAFGLSSLTTGQFARLPWGILAGSSAIFLLGLLDDLRPLSPQTKLLGQMLAAAIVVFLRYTTEFFPWQLANIMVTFFWLVGIANAINLLDNMDGLAGGISVIAAGFLSYFFWRSGNEVLLTLSLAIAGSVLGFLVFNFPPAKIFMGDSGSLFLGFTLAAVAVAREPQASNVFAVLGVPLMLLLLPILDTTMVTFTRILRGQSPSRGGKDHTSHRLVGLGLTERQAVLILYGVAVISGVGAITLEAFSYSLSLILIPVLVISLSLFIAYLARMKVVPVVEADSQRTVILRLLAELTYKRRLLEVLMDFFFIGLTYYLAFAARFGLPLVRYNMRLYLQSLPLIIASAYLSFFALGIYRGVWRYIGLEDMVQYAKAVGLSAVLAGGGLVILYRFEGYSRAVFMLYPLFLFLALAASRISFRLLDQMAGRRRQLQIKVLIYGAGDAGEMALRECRQNPKLGYEPLGFLDDDPLKKGRRVHGVEVLGSLEQLEEILESTNASGLIIASQDIWDSGRGSQALTICNSRDVWVRRLKLEFELEEYS